MFQCQLGISCAYLIAQLFQVLFEQHYNTGKISKQQVKSDQDVPQGFARVQCFPFFTLVSAMNVSTVDYFSLDVEGAELDVLKTIPFDSIFIKVQYFYLNGYILKKFEERMKIQRKKNHYLKKIFAGTLC